MAGTAGLTASYPFLSVAAPNVAAPSIMKFAVPVETPTAGNARDNPMLQIRQTADLLGWSRDEFTICI